MKLNAMRSSLIIASLILSICVHSLKAQDTITRDMIYRTTVRILSDPSFSCYGALYEVNDSSISISSRRIKDYYSREVEALRFPMEDINVINIHKPGYGRKGALIGAASGIALGVLMEAVSDPGYSTRGLMVAGGAAMGLIVRAPTGFIAGKIAGYNHIPIKGSRDEFDLNKEELKEYAIKK